MTSGNTRPTRERFVAETLALIAEQGGSQGVNLRQISRRVGCAHTNAYNYFSSFDDLLWAAFRRALLMYAESITRDLDDSLQPPEYVHRVVANLAAFPQEHPGLFRFIGSDPISADAIPGDVLAIVSTMKGWLIDALTACAGGAAEAEEACNVVLAYIDGETLNLINARVVPGEDVAGRIVANGVRLFELLSGTRDAPRPEGGYPTLELDDAVFERGEKAWQS